MRGLRAAVVGAVSALVLPLGATPAEAATLLTIEGQMSIGCYGCGWYGPEGNSASFTVTGLLNNEIVTGARGHLEYTATMPEGAACVASGTFYGRMVISTPLQPNVESDFQIIFAGQTGHIYASDLWAQGVITMVITEPRGNPCGGSIEASFAGTLGGA